MKHRSFRGFTLIELLVVIAIVGVLATIVISSLSESRRRANYTRMKAEFRQLPSQAELYFLEHNTYAQVPVSGPCPTSPSSNPTNVFESQRMFEIVEGIADRMGTQLDRTNEVACIADNSSFVFLALSYEYFDLKNNDPLYSPDRAVIEVSSFVPYPLGFCIDNASSLVMYQVNLNNRGYVDEC